MMTERPEEKILQLAVSQIYPSGRQLRPDFLASGRSVILTKETPIASMGDCFAREIKKYLVRNRYNYIQTATGPNAEHGSAAWDRVYNTFCLKQEVQRAFEEFEPAEQYWFSGNRYLDPYRKAVAWNSLQEREQDLQRHCETAKEALLQAKLLIMTIGLNEIWYSRQDGSVFFQIPPADLFDSAKHAFRSATVEENVANLEGLYRLLAQYNPECRILVGVGPVPLRATFHAERNIIISDLLSKSILVVAVHEFVARHENVHYFPSYDFVTSAVKSPFRRDNRHVKRSVIRKMMKMFEKMYVEGKETVWGA